MCNTGMPLASPTQALNLNHRPNLNTGMPLASHGTIAALEVGGASTQITFAYPPQLRSYYPREEDEEEDGGGGDGGGGGGGGGADGAWARAADVARRVVSVEVGGHAYGVYTHSYLGLGQDEVLNPTPKLNPAPPNPKLNPTRGAEDSEC